MDNAKLLRERAERCFSLARGLSDRQLIAQLRMFGNDYQRRADKSERAARFALEVPPPSRARQTRR